MRRTIKAAFAALLITGAGMIFAELIKAIGALLLLIHETTEVPL